MSRSQALGILVFVGAFFFLVFWVVDIGTRTIAVTEAREGGRGGREAKRQEREAASPPPTEVAFF